GYFVHVSKDVSALGKEKVDSALKNLDERLTDALAVIPKNHRQRLDMIRFWIEWQASDLKSATGYVPIINKSVGTGDAKEGGIEIGVNDCLLDKDQLFGKQNPYWISHELAHAYHDRVLNFEYPMVKEKYKIAMHKKLYDEVKYKRLDSAG